MSGVNSHTHDPIAIGGQLDWGTKEVFKCELCEVEMPEEALTHYDGYKACSECIESSEKEKRENEQHDHHKSLYRFAVREGRSKMAAEILDASPDVITKYDLIRIISKLQA